MTAPQKRVCCSICHKLCLFHVSGWDMDQQSKYMLRCFNYVFSSSYHTDICPSARVSDKFLILVIWWCKNRVKSHYWQLRLTTRLAGCVHWKDGDTVALSPNQYWANSYSNSARWWSPSPGYFGFIFLQWEEKEETLSIFTNTLFHRLIDSEAVCVLTKYDGVFAFLQ